MNNIRLQILKGSQQEHDKILKDLIYVYGHDSPRMIKMQDERNKITDEINLLLKQQNKK